MTAGEIEPVATRRVRVEAYALAGVVACFFAVLVYVNCFWSCYPNDNDLDEVGWLTAHLSLWRPESFANQGYPPGLPVVLRFFSPLVGTFLRATFLWQSIAAATSVFFVFRITTSLCRLRVAGPLALLCAMIAGLPVFTSEFADGTSTALFLGGLWLLTRRAADRQGFFLFGLAAGLSYLFRTHYLILIALVPAALLAAGFGWRTTAKGSLAFLAGFAATAWPLWLVNVLTYGTPVHAGVSQYNIALSVIPGAFDWENYPNTYNQWPVSRILRERPLDFFNNALGQALATLGLKLSLAGAVCGAFATVLVPDRQRRQWLAFSAILALLYILVVIVPTRYTDRAYAPVAMLSSVLVGCGLAELVSRALRPRWAALGALLTVLFLTYPAGLWDQLKGRAGDAQFNKRLVKELVAAGMQSSAEVFSNEWNIYNMADPQFITFYNYGGWIELDSLYARERPHPIARSVEQWQAFFAEHGIRFALLRQNGKTQDLFRRTPASWKQLFADRGLTLWQVAPPPLQPREGGD
jgi:hypothetical protein